MSVNKDATLKALLSGESTNLMIRTTGDQVYLNENTTVSAKIAEIVAAINNNTPTGDTDGIQKALTELSNNKADKTAIAELESELTSAINLKADKSAVDTMNTNLTTSIGLKADQTAVTNLESELTESIGKKADQSTVDTLESDMTEALNLKVEKSEVEQLIEDLKQEILGDVPVEAYDTFTELAAYIAENEDASEALTEAIGKKADVAAVNEMNTNLTAAINLKADKTVVDALGSELTESISKKADKSALDTLNTNLTASIGEKADVSAMNTLESELTESISKKADISVVNTLESELTESISKKADQTTVDDLQVSIDNLGDLATKSVVSEGDLAAELSGKINAKAEQTSVDAMGDIVYSLGDLAGKNKVSESDLDTDLAAKINSSSGGGSGESTGGGETAVWISQEDYDALPEEEKMNGTSYDIYDANVNDNAYTIPFTSELYEAENVGDALVEAKSNADNSVWLSQEEYDALSEEEKMDGRVYRVYDADANDNAYTIPFTSELYEAKNTGDALVEVANYMAYKDLSANFVSTDAITIEKAYVEGGQVVIQGFLKPQTAGGSFILQGTDAKYFPRHLTAASYGYTSGNDLNRVIQISENTAGKITVWTVGANTGAIHFNFTYPLKNMQEV